MTFHDTFGDVFRRFQVLEHRDFRAVSGTPREALQAQARLEELPPGPWQQQAQPRSRAAVQPTDFDRWL